MPNIRFPANGEAVPSSAHLSILGMRRVALEAYIEELIALLDTLDGDADAEPELGWLGNGRVCLSNEPSDDREGDDERDWDAGSPCGGDHGIADGDAASSEEFLFAGWTGDGSGVERGEAMIRGLPRGNDRPTMKALIVAGWEPERSEIGAIGLD
jgi:hypothetical protein